VVVAVAQHTDGDPRAVRPAGGRPRAVGLQDSVALAGDEASAGDRLVDGHDAQEPLVPQASGSLQGGDRQEALDQVICWQRGRHLEPQPLECRRELSGIAGRDVHVDPAGGVVDQWEAGGGGGQSLGDPLGRAVELEELVVEPLLDNAHVAGQLVLERVDD